MATTSDLPFTTASSVVSAGRAWTNPNNALTVNADFAAVNFFFTTEEFSEELQLLLPQAGAQIPLAETIRTIQFRILGEEIFAPNETIRLEDVGIQGGPLFLGANLSSSVGGTVQTFSKTISEWGLSVAQAREFADGTRYMTMSLHKSAGSSGNATGRIYWVTCQMVSDSGVVYPGIMF
jgi:hypothetical protein